MGAYGLTQRERQELERIIHWEAPHIVVSLPTWPDSHLRCLCLTDPRDGSETRIWGVQDWTRYKAGHRTIDSPPADTKRCTTCGERKPLDAFSRDRYYTADGRRSQCKACRAKADAERRAYKRVLSGTA